MGMDIRMVLTPFIEVKGGKKKVDIPKVKRLCLNHPKSKQHNNKFCTECGSEIVSQDYYETEELDAMDILRKWDEYDEDSLSCAEYLDNVIFPNQYPPDNIDIEENISSAINILDKQDLAIKQVEWFKNKYSKEIDFLVKVFGNDNVVVGWGFIHYWS